MHVGLQGAIDGAKPILANLRTTELNQGGFAELFLQQWQKYLQCLDAAPARELVDDPHAKARFVTNRRRGRGLDKCDPDSHTHCAQLV